MVTFCIDAPLFDRFPALRVGGFVATDLDRAASVLRTEPVVRRALKKGAVVTCGPIAALCSLISARHLAPIVGHDVDALPKSALCLRGARPASDWFLPLGARPSDLPLHHDVVVYAAGEVVLSCSFSHCESRQTCLDAHTRRAVFFSEAAMPQHASVAETALCELRRALADRGAGVSALTFADIHKPHVAMQFSDEDRP